MNHKSKKQGAGAAARLKAGAAVLEGAGVIDTQLVAARLEAFREAHRRYDEAHSAVLALQARVVELDAQVDTLDAAHDDAIEELMRVLVLDRKPRRNPLGGYGIEPPSRIQHRGPAAKVAATAMVVAAVQADATVSERSREATEALRRAAQAVAERLAQRVPIAAELEQARAVRDAIAPDFDKALQSLRRGARIAADEGAPNLYAILFGGIDKPTRRKATSEPEPSSDATPAAAA